MIKRAIFHGIYNPCRAVVLPPLPGEEGEIYDDVVDPNLEVRWEVMIVTHRSSDCSLSK